MKLQILVKTLQIISQNLHVCSSFEEKGNLAGLRLLL